MYIIKMYTQTYTQTYIYLYTYIQLYRRKHTHRDTHGHRHTETQASMWSLTGSLLHPGAKAVGLDYSKYSGITSMSGRLNRVWCN